MIRGGLIALCLFGMSLIAHAAPGHFTIPGETGIPVTRYAAQGKTLLVWLPSEFGRMAQEDAIAAQLATRGHEVWLADLYAARFLPIGASSADALPAADVQQVLQHASRNAKHLYLITAGRGARYALEGARLWAQQSGRKKPLAGAVLLYPNLYENPPEPGDDPRYLPIASETRLAITLIQGERSPWYWTLDSLQTALSRGGSKVVVHTLPNIRDRFHFREDANEAERTQAGELADLIHAAIATPPARSKP